MNHIRKIRSISNRKGGFNPRSESSTLMHSTSSNKSFQFPKLKVSSRMPKLPKSISNKPENLAHVMSNFDNSRYIP